VADVAGPTQAGTRGGAGASSGGTGSTTRAASKKSDAEKSGPKKSVPKKADARKGTAKPAGAKRTTGSTTAAAAKKQTGSKPTRGLDRFVVRPDIAGPRVRLGVLWFLVAMAAATAGRWWTGVLWAVVAGAAGRSAVLAWADPQRAEPDARAAGTGWPVATLAWVVAVLAAVVPLAAAAGTGLAGLALVVVSLVALALSSFEARSGGPGTGVVVGIVLPAVTAASVVLVVGTQLWAGLFLILAVSLYDAGNFVMGAESSSRLEGPISGIVGVLAVTFTMATFQAPPFDTATAWIAGGVVAVACPVGQWVTSAFLPGPDAPARPLRRIDAYILAAPLFLAGVWAVS
jgi:hypothetical protein